MFAPSVLGNLYVNWAYPRQSPMWREFGFLINTFYPGHVWTALSLSLSLSGGHDGRFSRDLLPHFFFAEGHCVGTHVFTNNTLRLIYLPVEPQCLYFTELQYFNI